jgi:hypothetical protein
MARKQWGIFRPHFGFPPKRSLLLGCHPLRGGSCGVVSDPKEGVIETVMVKRSGVEPYGRVAGVGVGGRFGNISFVR